MGDADLVQDEEHGNSSPPMHRALLWRLVVGLPLIVPALLVPALLVPMAVESKTQRDLLVVACQFVLASGVALCIRRPTSRDDLVVPMVGAVGAVAAYWVALRGGWDLGYCVAIVLLAMGWLIWGEFLLTSRPERRSAPQAMDAIKRARLAYRVFVVLVCVAIVEWLFVGSPLRGEPPTGRYVLLVVTITGAMVAYVHFRLALLATTLSVDTSAPFDHENEGDQTAIHTESVGPGSALGHDERE